MSKNGMSITKRIAIITYAAALLAVLSGCMEQELAPDVSHLDVLDTNDEENGKSLNRGVTQRLDVNGEKFKLIVNYLSGSEKWSINANKKLYMEIKTEGLPAGLKVFIDNIHMDSYIVASKAPFDGIKQDSMDDRVHNSLMLGFPISDTTTYFGVSEIEGQNETFIEGYFHGGRYYSSGSVEQKRRLESDYLKDGVWANRVDSVIDLILVDKGTLEQVSFPHQ